VPCKRRLGQGEIKVAGNSFDAVGARDRAGLPPVLRKYRSPVWTPGSLPDAWFERRRERAFEVGLLVPTSGPAGIWGPSTISCARLAVEEINRDGGLLGQEVHLRIIDAADEVDDLAQRTDDMLDSAQIDAIVGMHISSVRQKLLGAVRGRVPYVYTPLYEGGERTPGVYAIGETPGQQLRPAIHALTERFGLKRWALLGNDYVWPRISHVLARTYIGQAGGVVLDDLYLPFAINDFAPVLDRLAALDIDGLLLSLVGEDAVRFNREFGDAGRRFHDVVRLSTAIEENGLLAIGAQNTERLHVAAAYFASVPSDANMAFKERYYTLFGERAPTLNALGQSTYEGMHFLAALLQRSERTGAHWWLPSREPLQYRSARDAAYIDNDRKLYPMYLARAEGHLFEVGQRL
jgi:ABC-type branched-subunit amino acid transport system substrate-binding protein